MDDYIEHSEMSILEGWETRDEAVVEPLVVPSLLSDGSFSSAVPSDETVSGGLLSSSSSEDLPAQVI